MQRFRSTLAVLATALLGPLAFAGAGQAQEFVFDSAGSSRVLTGISNPLGEIFFEVTTQGRGGLGNFFAVSHVQLVPVGPSPNCELDELGAQIVDIQTTTTYADLSQIVSQGSGFQCVTANGSIRGSLSSTIVFATGRFEGRTGTLQATFTGQSVGIMNQVAVEGTVMLD